MRFFEKFYLVMALFYHFFDSLWTFLSQKISQNPKIHWKTNTKKTKYHDRNQTEIHTETYSTYDKDHTQWNSSIMTRLTNGSHQHKSSSASSDLINSSEIFMPSSNLMNPNGENWSSYLKPTDIYIHLIN